MKLGDTMKLKVLADRLKTERLNKKLSKFDVTERLGLSSYKWVEIYEDGRQQPDLLTIVQFAELYGVSVDYLLGRTPLRNVYENTEDFAKGYEELKETVEEEIKGLIEATKNSYVKAQELQIFVEKEGK